ncbi:hypothetical protein ACFL0U_00450 [Pseudomonadota bacterium]
MGDGRREVITQKSGELLPERLSKALKEPDCQMPTIIRVLQEASGIIKEDQRLRRSIAGTLVKECSAFSDEDWLNFLYRYIEDGGNLKRLFFILSRSNEMVSPERLQMILVEMSPEEFQKAYKQTQKTSKEGRRAKRKRAGMRIPIFMLARVERAIIDKDPEELCLALREFNAELSKVSKKERKKLTSLLVNTLDECFSCYSRKEFIRFAKQYSKVNGLESTETLYRLMPKRVSRQEVQETQEFSEMTSLDRRNILYVVIEPMRAESSEKKPRFGSALSLDSGLRQQKRRRISDRDEELQVWLCGMQRKYLERLRTEIFPPDPSESRVQEGDKPRPEMRRLLTV